MATYTNALQIAQRTKGIPYGGSGEIRDDGDANYGFKNLKAFPHLIKEIPELARDEALCEIVTSLNRRESAFATVGCVSGLVDDEQGHRVSGYVEFAFDSVERAADASNLFPPFFHFDRNLHQLKFDARVHFHWELMGAVFLESDSTGWTAIVTVNTDYHSTPENAEVAWSNGLAFLDMILSSVPKTDDAPLFTEALSLQ